MGLTRRSFIKLTGLAIGGLTFGGIKVFDSYPHFNPNYEYGDWVEIADNFNPNYEYGDWVKINEQIQQTIPKKYRHKIHVMTFMKNRSSDPLGQCRAIMWRYSPKFTRVRYYEFGENASKKTCLWLKNLPSLSGQNRKVRYFVKDNRKNASRI